MDDCIWTQIKQKQKEMKAWIWALLFLVVFLMFVVGVQCYGIVQQGKMIGAKNRLLATYKAEIDSLRTAQEDSLEVQVSGEWTGGDSFPVRIRLVSVGSEDAALYSIAFATSDSTFEVRDVMRDGSVRKSKDGFDVKVKHKK